MSTEIHTSGEYFYGLRKGELEGAKTEVKHFLKLIKEHNKDFGHIFLLSGMEAYYKIRLKKLKELLK